MSGSVSESSDRRLYSSKIWYCLSLNQRMARTWAASSFGRRGLFEIFQRPLVECLRRAVDVEGDQVWNVAIDRLERLTRILGSGDLHALATQGILDQEQLGFVVVDQDAGYLTLP